jgi:hypothetical protein
MLSLIQRLKSWRHGISYQLSERLRVSAGVYVETPAHTLPDLNGREAARIAELQAKYQVCFEQRLNAKTSLGNYEYLDILDRGWPATRALSEGGELVDVGCASFWYAAALHAFFKPRHLLGVDLEGYRRFRDGHTRIDYARGYVRDLPNAQFRVGDYADIDAPADVITAWFPFVTVGAILAWRLPSSFLRPERLFDAIRHNLTPHGLLIMINHGLAEAQLAGQLCIAAGLVRLGGGSEPGPFSGYRLQPPIMSCWCRTSRKTA